MSFLNLGLSDIVGGALGFLGGERTNSANASIAQKQMNFQERMSNTSYQRAVADLKSAGLNPMLAYTNGGASSPVGSSYTASDSISSGVQGFQKSLERNLMREQIANADKQGKLLDAQVRTEEERKGNVHADTWVKYMDWLRGGQAYDKEQSNKPYWASNAQNEALIKLKTYDKLVADIDEIQQRIKTGQSSAAHLDALAKNLGLDSAEKEQFAKFITEMGQGGQAAKFSVPFLMFIQRILGK